MNRSWIALGRAVGLLVVVALAGCVSAQGTKAISDPDLVSKIEPGVSTKDDVTALLGSPDDTTFTDSGSEIWKYVYQRAEYRKSNFIPVVGTFAGGTDLETSTLTVLWDEDGVVRKVSGGSTTGGGGGMQDLSR